MTATFDQSIFINCPFDDEFAPILQAISFCAILLGFTPRIAPENADNATPRLDRIAELVRSSRYGIHDLSRCQAVAAGEFARMNMPFELGMDHAARRFGQGELARKSILVLEANRYDYQRALSDISGWDIEPHNNVPRDAMVVVRGWLIRHARAENIGLTKIEGQYLAFQEWYYEKEIQAGASETDIRRYPTIDLIAAMHEWMPAGQPT